MYGMSVDEMAQEIEETHYIFNDEEDHPWNMEVVENVINKQPVKNRFTGYTYNF